MNFFSSLLGEDAPPPKAAQHTEDKEQNTSKETLDAADGASGLNALDTSGLLSFFGSLAKKSEEVLSTYQKDLAEFGQELKKETFSVVDTSTKAIPEVPQLLETGASQAQNNLEKVGHVIEDFGTSFWKGTTEIFGQVKEAITQADQEITATAKREKAAGSFAAIPRGKYSRFEAQVNAMQRDSGTYCDEPEDAEDFAKWKEEFDLDSKKEEIEKIGKENAFMQELQSRIVPLIVEYDTFWTRYFYRLYKLKQAEEARAGLVKRASALDEEELSWDVEEPNTPTASGAPRPQKSSPSLAPVPEGDKLQADSQEEAPPAAEEPADLRMTSAEKEMTSAEKGETSADKGVTSAEKEEEAAPPPEEAAPVSEAKGAEEESKKDSPVVPASPRGGSEEEGTHSDGSPEGSTGSGWFVVGSGTDKSKADPKTAAVPKVDEPEQAKELDSLEVDDLDVEEPEGAPEVTPRPAAKERTRGGEEEGEDWGAWE